MKNILKKSGALAAAALLTVAFASPSFAADGDKKPGKPKKDRFAKVDTDGNGKINLDEFKAQAAKAKAAGKTDDAKLEKRFKALDKDASGDLNKEEFAASHAKKKDGDKKKDGKPDEAPKSE